MGAVKHLDDTVDSLGKVNRNNLLKGRAYCPVCDEVTNQKIVGEFGIENSYLCSQCNDIHEYQEQ